MITVLLSYTQTDKLPGLNLTQGIKAREKVDLRCFEIGSRFSGCTGFLHN